MHDPEDCAWSLQHHKELERNESMCSAPAKAHTIIIPTHFRFCHARSEQETNNVVC